MGNGGSSGHYAFGPCKLDPSARVLTREGEAVAVGSRAFDMLVALVQRPGEVISRRELMSVAWPGLNVEDSNVRVQMAHLRREIGCGENGKRYVTSVAGRGYCFVAPVEWLNFDLLVEQHGETEVLESLEDVAGRSGRETLPPRLEHAVGRKENLSELAQTVEERRLVTIVGPGGIGKTTLAILLAYMMESFPRAHFVDLSSADDTMSVIDAMLSGIGLEASEQPVVLLARHFAQERILVILDNCEHVIDAVAEVLHPIVRQSTGTHFLATSREAFRIQGEAVYLLRPLASPPHTGRISAEQALAWPAVQLLLERALDGGYTEPLDDEQATTAAAICRRLDGNPLAIELVASRIGTYGIDGVADLLDNQMALRWRGNRYSPQRHQTVESMLDWSYALLSESERMVLRRLSVFAGEFSLETAAAVVRGDEVGQGELVEAIATLVDKSLIVLQRGKGPVRLRLLGVTRTYAAMKLAESGESSQAVQRLSRFQDSAAHVLNPIVTGECETQLHPV